MFDSDINTLIDIILRSPDKKEGINAFINLKDNIICRTYETASRLDRLLKDACEREDMCPKCGEEIVIKEHTEDRGDCRGFPSSETVTERVCSSCGYTY